MLHDGEPNEYRHVPQCMGEDDGAKILRKQAIEQSPSQAGNKGCHGEHEVHGAGMYQSIDEGGYNEAFVGVPLLR